LAPLQRTANDLQQAYADLVAACSSTRPSNALPAMLRAQAAASALAAGLSVLSNFVAVALNPRDHAIAHDASDQHPIAKASAVADVEEVEEQAPTTSSAPTPPTVEPELEWADTEGDRQPERVALEDAVASAPPELQPEAAETPAFEVASLSSELQDLHRRANRVAKVAMQDIKLLRPKDVRLARENKDICTRLRSDLDKARKEYDRRFRSIQDHPVDYFHHWMVEILAEGHTDALGEYPYPSPVLRH
jgi:hypothetical protein